MISSHAPPNHFIDRTYKTTPAGDLSLRIFPAQVSSGGPRPWALHIHGGGFVFGTHTAPLYWLSHGFVDRGYHVVSIAYRFAPEVGYDEIIQDCHDAYAWCREHLGAEVEVDIDRCVFTGDSAGGNLVMTLAQTTQYRPRAVVDIYGLVDFAEPHPFPINALPLDVGRMTEKEILDVIQAQDASKARSWCAFMTQASDAELIERHALNGSGVVLDEDTRRHFAVALYLFTRHLVYPVLFRRTEGMTDDEDIAIRADKSVINHVDATFPPTVIIHGTADTAVDVSHSQRLGRKLRGLDVPTLEIYVEGAGHVLDDQWTKDNFGHALRVFEFLAGVV